MILTHKGLKINYTTTGKGAPIVFLHGFLENISMWKELVFKLSKKYQCICIDLPGHGDSECLGYIHTMEDMAKIVNAVLIQLQITTATCIGHSMGGYVALAFADIFPDAINGLVLLNSTSFPDSPERQQNRTRAINIVKKNPKAYTSMAIANLFAEKNRSQYAQEINDIKNQASKTSLQGIIAALEGMKIRLDRRSVLAGFKKPKLIISGKLDPVLVHATHLEESTTCDTKIIPLDGGHMSYIENKEELLQALTNFMITV